MGSGVLHKDVACQNVWVGDIFAITRADGLDLSNFFQICILDN